MVDQDLIKEKIRNIQEYLNEIKSILALPDTEIVYTIEKLRTLERNFQLIVDEALDINIHLIKELNLESPDDFQSTFEILGEHKILPYDFAYEIASVVGLRNKIVHRYETIDRKLFVKSFKKNYPDFERFIQVIHDYIVQNKNHPTSS